MAFTALGCSGVEVCVLEKNSMDPIVIPHPPPHTHTHTHTHLECMAFSLSYKCIFAESQKGLQTSKPLAQNPVYTAEEQGHGSERPRVTTTPRKLQDAALTPNTPLSSHALPQLPH